MVESDRVAATGAAWIREALGRAIASRGRASLVLSGGTTPAATYRALAREAVTGGWGSVEVWFADERGVPPDDPESNYRMARATLIDPAAIPAGHVHRMEAERPDLDAAARDYDSGFPERADVLVLGIGEDGHTASLFPHHAALEEHARRVVAVRDSPKPPPVRLTVTPRVLAEAGAVLVLATGLGKAGAVAAALGEAGDVHRTPARLVRDREWLVDRDAASQLP